MANKDLIATFENTISECMGTPIEKLIARPELGTLNFEELRIPLQNFFGILDKYSKSPLDKLTDQTINQLNAQLAQILETIKQIKDFIIEQENAKAVQTQIIHRFNSQFDEISQSAALWLPYLWISQEKFDETISRLDLAAAELEALFEEKKKSTEQKISEIDSIISAAREAAGSAGVSHYTDDFEEEAGERATSAGRWLAATVVAAIITVISAVLAFLWLPLQDNASAALIVQHVTTKLIVLGMLFSTTVWCGQMYRANKHLETENRMRANGLKTFQAFKEATIDPQTRDAVLMETTRSIFAHAATGYINQPPAAEGSGRIIEIVRSAAEKATSE